MAQVIIVSKTRMAGGCVCVGGVDIDNRRPLRLLDARGHHETASVCPYAIWDIWDIDYYLTNKRPCPHTEDANVTRRAKVETVAAASMSVNRFAEVLLNSNIPLFRGSLFSVFDGKLKRTDNDKLFISKGNVPDYSTCFWISDRQLIGYESRGRWQYRYPDQSNRYGYTIVYVGAAYPADTIEAGSLIRLSLAHWWKPEDSDDEERCYLQLSGCLIEGQAHSQETHAIPLALPTKQPSDNNWFDSIEQELDKLLLEKTVLEERIIEIRSRIMQQMANRHLEKLTSTKYSINYSPVKTILQFDRKAFKSEHEALYNAYCVPKQKEASLVIRKNRAGSE